ncbi:MAG: ATP-binding protein, partial [Thermoguttaceae bacterium]|nr:ATP-binding protein [Thermoguttaceae bacterium]
MQPWNTNAIPHDDVLRGTMDQADFAADLSAAASGSGPEEYRDPRKFFERTYITDGMRRLMVSVVRRLAAGGGDPVVQLQTGFGGGKTHTLLAVYHRAKGEVPARELDGVSLVLDEAGGAPPSARVAVIDGLKLSPAQPREEGKIKIATLWGELAWQLLGAEGYKMVAPSDQSAVAPGKDVLIPLLKQAAPCVLLFDELTAFIRKLPEKELPAGTFENNLSFLQALTESVKQVEGAVLLATLPESAAEVGDVDGQRALEALNKLFGRLDSVWKPVGTEESFEIVRRRLFKSAGDEAVRDEVCRAFARLYADHPNDFPQKAREGGYFARLQKSYPIHPEVFDRLYDDWSTLEGFQKTRGVLRYLALVIRQLKANENSELLIMPGSLPLDHSDVRNESTRYLSQSTNWGSVIESEIDTDRSKAKQIDVTNERIGQVYGARRVARAIFFGTAPYTSNLSRGVNHGMSREEIHLGCVAPGQGIGHYDDALRVLTDRLHYLFSGEDRFWFDTHPNLLREMESRAAKVTDTEIMAELQKRVGGLIDSRSGIFTS